MSSSPPETLARRLVQAWEDVADREMLGTFRE